MNNEKILGFKRNHAGGDEKLVVNKCWPYIYICIFMSFECNELDGKLAPIG